jgi:predicted MFS family arabinose efflux permease
MALSMLPLYLLGALGPYLVSEFGITQPLLGLLVTVGFGVAAILSPLVGPTVPAIGPRRCLISLFVGCAVALTLFAVAPVYGALVAAVAASGVPQALANPSTNQLIAGAVPAKRRGGITGVKQSGVQVGAFFAGLPLAALAAAVNWRVAVVLAVATALAGALAALTLPADPASVLRPQWTSLAWPRGNAAWLCGFSVLLGAGSSAVNTYVALYAVQQLRMPPELAAALIAALGVAGIVGRIGWSRVAIRGRSPGMVLPPLALGAALAAIALIAATRFGAGWAWFGAVGVGSCAVSANAVSMVIVIAGARPGQVARDSAGVSAGFFAGLALGPPVFGCIIQAAGGHYEWGWVLVAVEFLAAGALAWTNLAPRALRPAPAWDRVSVSARLPALHPRGLLALATAISGLMLGGLIIIDRNQGSADQSHSRQPGMLAAPSSSMAVPPALAVPNVPFVLPVLPTPTPSASENTGASPRLVHPTPSPAQSPAPRGNERGSSTTGRTRRGQVPRGQPAVPRTYVLKPPQQSPPRSHVRTPTHRQHSDTIQPRRLRHHAGQK